MPSVEEEPAEQALPAGSSLNLTCSPSLDRDKTNLSYDLLTSVAQNKVDKLFRQASRLTVGVKESGPGVGILFLEHRFVRWRGSIDGNHLDAACFGISEAHVTDRVRILGNFGRNLLVA